jgi:nicotinate-nucleotide pyrophosphorylase (carboxylating)
MLDNMEGNELVNAARTLKEKWRGQRKFLFESSGNITEANLRERAINGELDGSNGFHQWLTFLIAEIDILSTSAVHQSVQHIDFSLKIQKPKP